MWVLPAHVGVLGLAAFLYIYNLTVSGFANTYYSMAAQAASPELVGLVLRLARSVELHHRRQAAAGDDGSWACRCACSA